MITGVVLFDADGVIQRTAGGWRERFAEMLDDTTNLDAFVAEIFASERPCLTGAVDFPTQLGEVLKRWRSRVPVEQALTVWTNIEVDEGVVELIAALRRSGVTCCLASNQQTHRAHYMSSELGYRSLFDREFYSCRVGHAKPDAAYFEHILADLGLAPEQALFIDDVEPNVISARQVGIPSVHFAANAGAEVLSGHLAAHGIRVS
jgi:putative hydrolase of the HAD superfamily